MKKILLVGILALVVVGCVLAAGCTYDDDEAAAQLAMGNLGALSLGSGAMVTEEKIAELDAALPAMIAEVNAASGASMTGEKALELKKNIIGELEKASRASGYMTDEFRVDPSKDTSWIVILVGEVVGEANRASGTMMTDEQLAALGAAIEAKLGETSPASGCITDMKTGERIITWGPNGDIAPSPASGTFLTPTEDVFGLYPFGAFIVN